MRPLLAIFLFMLLSACDRSGPGQMAANACVAEVGQRLQGKTYDLDEAELATHARQETSGSDIWILSAEVMFDRGLATEFTQNLNCKARVDADKATVLWLEFIWSMKSLDSMKDLNKVKPRSE